MKKNCLFAIILAIIVCLIMALVGCSNGNNAGSDDDTGKDDSHTYYTVTFDSKGGSVVESRRIKEGNTISRPDVPSFDGYSFTGWYKDRAATDDIWNFDTDRVMSDLTLYAGWSAVSNTEEPKEPTSSLIFAKENDAYIVTGVGEETAIVIPAEHDGLPVVAIRGQYGTGAFARKDITSVVIPDSITEIGQNTFNNCSKLVSVDIGENSLLTKIGNNAFSGCSSLKEIYLPSGVIELGDSVFNNCGALEKITVADRNTVYRSENGHLIERATDTLIRGGHNSVVPDGVKSIAQAAFRKANGIVQIYIPISVTAIGNYFIADCSITTIAYEGTQSEWDAIKKSATMWNYGNRDVTLIFGAVDMPTPEPTPAGNDVLIVYFSYSGNTESVANEIITQSGGDGVELVPAITYTSADVNYNDSSSRSQVERRNDARPEISEQTYSQIDMAEYKTVIIGYPIWNGYEPMIIRTFIEHYNGLSGKTVHTFSTAASSGGGTAHSSISGRVSATVGSNLHFTSSTLSSASTRVHDWLSDLGLLAEKQTDNNGVTNVRIKMTVANNIVYVTLVDNSASRDLVNRLKNGAITLSFSDFGGSEKIAYPTPALDVSGTDGCDPVVGDLTIYVPWGNLAAFYRDTSGYSDSLVLVGKIENNGIEIIAAQSGTFSVTLELID